MRRLFVLAVLLPLFLTACGVEVTEMPNLLPFLVTVTDTPLPEQAILASPTAEDTETPASTATPAQTATPALSSTPSGPTPTETLLPPLELPTERINPPALLAWTGEPTYPGESEPGRLFRVDYDPDLWAQTEGNFGDIVLAHRLNQYCTITPGTGRGLPLNWKVEHEFHQIGEIFYDVNTVSDQSEVKFVAYVGGDKRLLTGFQVSFQDQKDQCLLDAEVIFATLRSFAAQPTITPQPSATP